MSKANKKTLLYLGLCLLVSMCSAVATGASQHDIQQLRSLSYSVVDNALVFHNPLGTPYDPSNAQAYQHDLQQLMLKAQSLGLSDVSARAKQLSAVVADLQHLPQNAADSRATIPAYRQWLPQVIEQHAALLTLLDQHYTNATPGSAEQQALHQLSWDLQRLSLHYQITAFPYMSVQVWMLDDSTLNALDATVQQRLSQLPAGDDNLDKLAARYHFVRGYLLKTGENWAPNAVQRYLAGIATALDNAAGKLPL
ncbi:MAG: hypothetical protein AAAB16_07910 [Pseudomonas sp.]|uniref:hypothetical protein n=1 Tax=Pseudomonas sp. TaxID=306 RepID=UPI0030F1CDD7